MKSTEYFNTKTYFRLGSVIEIVSNQITNHVNFWFGICDFNQILESDFYTRLKSKNMSGLQVCRGAKTHPFSLSRVAVTRVASPLPPLCWGHATRKGCLPQETWPEVTSGIANCPDYGNPTLNLMSISEDKKNEQSARNNTCPDLHASRAGRGSLGDFSIDLEDSVF